ncbi:MAG: hypothetical protein CMQ07_00310 [Gammaproteobacteria bacterium]|nr:hypothetical protein [Gammaproteobacteria bacterium]
MALGDGGLDAQIEQRMDAYRGNPKKLQQRYGANKELLDLLALQKLTSEKKAVAADMQMKMQQQPGTIAQQREQEALQLTKQEMSNTLGDLAGRTKGVLDQKQKMQQKNMQQLAKTQPRKPAGIAGLPGLAGMSPAPQRRMPPQAQGVANARMMQAAQQGGPIRMAGGGIVAFANGGSPQDQSVTKAQIDAYRAQLGGSLRNISDAEIVNRIKQNLAPPTGVSRLYDMYQDFVTGVRAPRKEYLAGKETQKQEEQAVLDLAAAQAQADMSPNPKAMGVQSTLFDTPDVTVMRGDMFEPARGGVRPFASELPSVALGTDQPLVPPSPNAAAPAQVNVAQSSEKGAPENTTGIPAALQNFKLASGAPSAGGGGVSDLASVLQSSASAADDILGRSDKAARFAEMLAESRAKEAELFSPESQRSDRLNKFLTGGANTTTLGGLAKGAVDASQATKAKQNADAMARMAKRFELEVSGMNVDATLGGAALNLGMTVYQELGKNNRNAQTLAQQRSKAELEAGIAAAEQAWKETDAEVKNEISAKLADAAALNAKTSAAAQTLKEAKEERASKKEIADADLAVQARLREEYAVIQTALVELQANAIPTVQAKLREDMELLNNSKMASDTATMEQINKDLATMRANYNDPEYIKAEALLLVNGFANLVTDSNGETVLQDILNRYEELKDIVKGFDLGEQGGTPLGEVVSSDYTPEG